MVVSPDGLRPRLAAVLLTAALLTLFFGLHLTLYDAALYQLQHTSSNSASSSSSSSSAASASASSGSSSPPPLNSILNVPARVHFPRTSRRLPQAIIIGVRKCGTRALLEMLCLHPSVQTAAREVHFFDRDDNYGKGLDWYRKRMPHSFRGQLTLEKTPSYFVTPEVPERIRAMNSSVKLLLIVREPVTRAISDYTQLRSHAATASSAAPQPQPPRTFEQLAINSDGTVNSSYRPLSLSIYHTFIHRWLEVFSRNQILIVNGDRLIENPVDQLQRIEQFLGLEPRIGRHNFYFNNTKGFYCLRNDTADKCLRETKGRRHPRVDPVVVSKLRKYFSEHNQRFYDIVGEDLGWPEE
ncbi:heparan sulfate glucosamine 3-O-sulfotransferase 1 isoform X2 [Nilaparvata lugens]|nr:heparan sulfate glucosamine 3-O-sulfotransferase 1 isoform X2 [Nilaparvata lugens]XP_039292200.1 heparan sulfate glucosamine 3-O-sulfotransferase 1 isoform X2 [Nilaparvata lugens]XP_039292201.1 heparan sulfate glucosamine 3-O-sulfotransferase 1 isoform X2 [Nilaparvata lugens]